MDSESDNLVRKILEHLRPILNEISLLKDFEIIPTAASDREKNICPVRHVPLEQCLGLDSWCVPFVFKYVQKQIFKLRKNTVRKPTNDSVQALNEYLNVALLLQPEVTTFWNIKRELNLDFEYEMCYTRLVLSRKPKSLHTFNYRIWLINKLSDLSNISRIVVVQEELSVIDKACCKCPNNYHAWNQRIWCVKNLFPKLSADLMLFELRYSEHLLERLVSDSSCFHYRQFLLKQFKENFWCSDTKEYFLVDEYNNQSQFSLYPMLHSEYLNRLEDETLAYFNQYVCCLLYEHCNVLNVLHDTFPGHETIWCHRRFVLKEIYTVLTEIYAIKGENMNKFGENLQLPRYLNVIHSNVRGLGSGNNVNQRMAALQSSILYKKVFGSSEQEYLERLFRKSHHNSVEVSLIHKHRKWLDFVLTN